MPSHASPAHRQRKLVAARWVLALALAGVGCAPARGAPVTADPATIAVPAPPTASGRPQLAPARVDDDASSLQDERLRRCLEEHWAAQGDYTTVEDGSGDYVVATMEGEASLCVRHSPNLDVPHPPGYDGSEGAASRLAGGLTLLVYTDDHEVRAALWRELLALTSTSKAPSGRIVACTTLDRAWAAIEPHLARGEVRWAQDLGSCAALDSAR